MNLGIICFFHIATAIVCVLYINSKWKFYTTEMFALSLLRTHNIFSRVWPTDDGFLSLKMSALRHAIIPMILSIIIWTINVRLIHSVCTLVALLYIWLPIIRNRARKEDFKESSREIQPSLVSVKSASSSITICAIVNYVIVMLAFAVRP